MSLTLLTQKLLNVSGQIVTARGLNKKKTYTILNLISLVYAMTKNNVLYCHYRHFFDLVFLMEYQVQTRHFFVAPCTPGSL